MASLNAPADFQGWLPIRLWQREGEWRVDWCWFGQQRLTLPFLRDDVDRALRLPFNQALRRDTDIQALLDWQARSPGLAPSALVFHASRCGSTLIAQLLASQAHNIVLSEPPPLDNLLRAPLQDPGATAWQADAVSALMSAYGQRRQGDERQLVIKLDAWSVFEAPLLAELYPQVPKLFLYRDPLEIVVSQLRQAGMHRVPGLLGPSRLDTLLPDAQAMGVVEYSCRMIGEILKAGLVLCQQHGGIAVNYTELPDAIWGRLAPEFGVQPGDEPKLREVAAFDAKQPGMNFTGDSQRKREQASDEARDGVRQWASEAYNALESIRLQTA
ncbi:MAG: sulfotransferase family protein [Candidatus Pseudomonas phytovorans]|uniref:Sulfotransferase family protein n=1 Tax=Candidatus Pseudomonas phytovorans TaxID=3121377 RepID=A0AAJ6BE43_9PSED|nr:sulfotransferase family protein [Pseudomonas sp.]WEK32359.1 MAG: sulfotransferase family protein [Pseudomonas sp.]